MQIRLAIPADTPQIANLLYELNKFHQLNLPHDFKSPEDIAEKITIQDYFENEKKVALVAVIADEETTRKGTGTDKIVGFIFGDIWERKSWVLQERRIATIMDIAVDNAYQGQGIGKQLYHAFESHMKTLNADEIMVEVYDFNKTAMAFYQKCGIEPFLQVGRKRL